MTLLSCMDYVIMNDEKIVNVALKNVEGSPINP
jgi:hypothetical protein